MSLTSLLILRRRLLKRLALNRTFDASVAYSLLHNSKHAYVLRADILSRKFVCVDIWTMNERRPWWILYNRIFHPLLNNFATTLHCWTLASHRTAFCKPSIAMGIVSSRGGCHASAYQPHDRKPSLNDRLLLTTITYFWYGSLNRSGSRYIIDRNHCRH